RGRQRRISGSGRWRRRAVRTRSHDADQCDVEFRGRDFNRWSDPPDLGREPQHEEHLLPDRAGIMMIGEGAMHRYREFGLVSEQDEVLRRAFRDGFKRAGLSFAQFLDALAWYRDHARSAADETQLADAFAQFATERGWPAEQRDGALDLYRTVRD